MGRDRRPNIVILECFICQWDRGEVGRWKRWEVSEVARWERWEGNEVKRWERQGRVMRRQGGKGVRVVRWQGGEGGRVVRWEGGRFLVFFKSGECRLSPRFHLFVSDFNQGEE